MKAIVLVGFMGCGKTAVGRLLAERLEVPFVDLDDELERLEGKPIGRIFAEDGEAYFRRREREVLRSLAGGDLVLAVGGGAFTVDDNIAVINTNSVSVWLDCPLAICLARAARSPARRPLFSDAEEMAVLFRHRLRFYKRAHHRVDSGSGEPKEVAEAIFRELGLEAEA